MLKPPPPIQTPCDLSSLPKYQNFASAEIVKRDHDHAAIVDFLIAGMYRIYLLLDDRQWQEAFGLVYTSLTVVERFNENVIYSKHTFMLALLLQKMDLPEQAMQVLDYLRDFVEDTNLNKEAILVYELIGSIF